MMAKTSSAPNYNALILDLSNVLLMSSAEDVVAMSRRQLQNALNSPAWFDYERGKVSRQVCDDLITKDFSCDLTRWNAAIKQLRESLRPNQELIAGVRRLRLMYPQLRVYCMANIPEHDYERLIPLIKGWGIFDQVFASFLLGSRKPDFDSYEQVVREAKLKPESCIFVDDQLENVVAAQAYGFRAVLFQDTASAIAALQNLLGDAVARGLEYLYRHAKNLFSETTSGEIEKDNFGQLLILQCIGDMDLVHLEKQGPLWNYFIGETVYPLDSDTTALAMRVLEDIPAEEKESVMETMLSNVTPDGLPMCWFAHSRPRQCHCVSANIFRFFYLNGRGHHLRPAYLFVCRLLKTKAYLLGSRYYESPDWLLFILADLCAQRPKDDNLKDLRCLVHAEMRDRMGCDTDMLSAALRLVASQMLGIPNTWDLRTVLDAQQLDGGWGKVWLWRYGKENVKIGGRGVVTALAVRGIQLARTLEQQGKY